MEERAVQYTSHRCEESDGAAVSIENRQPWQEPKLAFVEPKLTHHGTVQEVTGQSFGTFVP
jgi:hypothetical protein